MTAGIIAAKHTPVTKDGQGTRIILLESPDVPSLGVGEGTWPTMRETLRKIGVSEIEFLRCCDAGFKQGSQFVGWRQGKNESYYHPFSPPRAYPAINLAEHWSESDRSYSFVDAVCSQGEVCDRDLAPKFPQSSEYDFSLNYGYHLNAGKFACLLQRHCVEKLAVEHKLGHVEQVVSAENGDIATLNLASGETVSGDLFIDCTGFAARLIGKHYKIPFVSQRTHLFNDTALAVQVGHSAEDSPIASCTRATAQSCGWIWDIALPTRRGIGYVFSSQHLSVEKAEEELDLYLTSDATLSTTRPAVRKINFDPGHREVFWHKNCVAIGVSAGFVEPLEATALILIEQSAEWISQQLPRGRSAMTVLAKRFNEISRQRWSTIIDVLKLLYVLSAREDSAYWRDHRQEVSIPESLQDALALWRSQTPWIYESDSRFELFSSASIQYVLYGMSFRTNIKNKLHRDWSKDAEVATRLFRENSNNTESLIASLPSNRSLLDQIGR